MYSFKFLLAGVVSLATLSSALPVVSNVAHLGSGLVPGVAAPALPRQVDVPALVNADIDADVDVEVFDKRCPGCLPETGTDAPEEPVSVLSILLDLNADLGETLGQINVAVSVDGQNGVAANINIDLVKQLLEDVQNLISDAIPAIAAAVSDVGNGGLDALLGGVLTVVQFCGVIAALLRTVIAILVATLTALSTGNIDTSVVDGVVATIVGLTGQLLVTVVGNFDGLTSILVPIVASLVGTLGGLGVDCAPITQAVAAKGL